MTDVVTGTLAGIALFLFGLGLVFALHGSAAGAIASFVLAITVAVIRGQGGPRVRTCSYCGARSTERGRFCPSCGRELG